MLKIYIIQAHRAPDQLKRLINRLNDNNSIFFIHIDLKSNISNFTNIIFGKNINFVKNRIDCIWGDFSQVQATINMLNEVKEHSFSIDDRIILLSGQDYPVKTIKKIDLFLNSNKDINFINIEKFNRSSRHHLRNFKAYKINHSSQRNDFSLISIWKPKRILLNLIKGKLSFFDLKYIFINKALPMNMVPYRGASWWSFNYSTVTKIMNFYNSNKEDLDNFYKFTFCADENFFHTILMHLKESDSSIKIMSSLTYDNWIRKGVPLPVTFTKYDIKELVELPIYKLFARKFDTDIDVDILDKLDQNL